MKRKRSDENAPRPKRAPSGAAVMLPAVTEALTRALFEEWARTGYAALSLENVARKAGVGKAALYRRWPSKLQMVADRLEVLGIELSQDRDTGSFRGDVAAVLADLRRLLRHPLIRRILPDLHAEMPRNPELAARIRGRLQTERRQRGSQLLRRAIERGELKPDVDAELLNDALGGMIYWRVVVTGGVADRRYLDDLCAFVVRASGIAS
jgi:AcrR family transcriptional regulator